MPSSGTQPTRSYIQRLAELAPSTSKIDKQADKIADVLDVDPEGSKSEPGRAASPIRLAQLFAESEEEQHVIALAFQRILTGERLTNDYRIILLNALRKVLLAAGSHQSNFLHLRSLLRGTTMESLSEAEAPAPQLLRLTRVLASDNASMLRIAISRLQDGDRLNAAYLRLLSDTLKQILDVFERHPDLLAMFIARVVADRHDTVDIEDELEKLA